MSARPLDLGSDVGGYLVVRLLGKGGMGEVYLVRHRQTGEQYALKVLSEGVAEKSPAFVRRFVREGEFARAIRHPNLVAVYEVGEDAGTGRHYIVMEYVPGGSVREALEKRGRFDIGETVAVIRQVSYGLAAAHQQGVIHRDIKPDNIMFAADGTPKLADLGIARFTDERRKSTVTTEGSFIGTPAYMSPEQMMNAHDVDARADIYSLGIVFYEMLTGSRPNEKDTVVQLMAKAVRGIPIPDVRKLRPEVSASLVQVLNVMCARRPEDRFDSTQTMVDVFERLRREGFDAHLGLRQPRSPRRRLWTACLAAAATLAAAGGAVAYDRLGVFTERYADWADSFGVPKGLGRLSRVEASHRSGYWRFSYRGRHGLFGARMLRETTYVNAFGIPIAKESEDYDDRPSRSAYHFSEDGSLAYVDRYTPYGRRWRRDVYSGKGNTYVDFKFPLVDGSLLSASSDGDARVVQVDPAGIAVTGFAMSCTAVRRLRMTRDVNGFIIREDFLANDMNVPVRGSHGAYARQYERDGDGRLTGFRCLDEKGVSFPFELGVSTKRIIRDSAGRVVVERNLDVSGHLTLGEYGWAERRLAWNAGDGCVRETYYDEEGTLSLSTDGVAARVRAFDEKGVLTSVTFLDLQGKPVNNGQGYARVLLQHDQCGFLSTERLEDAEGRPVAIGSGFYVNCYERDARGLETRRWYLDANGKPCAPQDKAAEMRTVLRSDGLTDEEAYYDVNGKPCPQSGNPWPEKAGMCRRHFLNDENGRQVGYQNLDGAGKPCVDVLGICEERLTYDAFGNIARTQFFGAAGEATVHPLLGCHALIRSYDESGRVTSVCFLDTDGKPCGYALEIRHEHARTGGGGVQRIDYTYNVKGDLELIAYRDAEGHPMADANGLAAIQRVYDARGLVIEERKMDIAGRLVPDRRTGCAITHCVRDSFGRITGIDEFDAVGAPIKDKRMEALHPKGVFYHWAYDSKSRKSRTWWVDADGRKVDGTESVMIYDKNGRSCGACYVDAAGKPVNGPRGYAYSEKEVDGQGRLVKVLYRRVDGTPHVLPKECWGGGFSGFIRRYYPNGSEMWILHLVENGKPGCYLGKCCGWARDYDTAGQVIWQMNLDGDGCVMQDKGGSYGWRLKDGKRVSIRERPKLPKAIQDSLMEYFANPRPLKPVVPPT